MIFITFRGLSLIKAVQGKVGACYEAGASVEVAPVDALGSGGWGQRRTPKRSVQRHSAAHGVEADVENKSRLDSGQVP